jgi:glutaredoxin
MSERIQITMIVRTGCHLCVAAEAALARVIGRFNSEHPDQPYNVTLTDISDQVDYQRFTDELPVLLINGEQVSFWKIDENRVFDRLQSLAQS